MGWLRLRLGIALRWSRPRWKRLLAIGGLATVLALAGWMWFLRSQFQLLDRQPTRLFEDRTGEYLSEEEGDDLGFWSVDDIPVRVERCFLAIEDHRFWDHGGVDLRALLRALANNASPNQTRQGASTIAMQVARMQNPGPRTYFKKLNEIVVAEWLVRAYGRPAVLTQYLEIVPMGNRIHGVAYAARRYFRKPLGDLSWAEAALLAALPKAPGEMNLHRRLGVQKAKQRGQRVLARVHQLGWMTDSEFSYASDHLNHLQIPTREVRPFHSVHAILRLQEEAAGAQLEADRPIRSSLDLGIQSQADALCYQAVESYRGQGAGNVAMIVMDVQTSEVLAYVGSAFYDDSTHSGAINYAQVPRSTGSTLKPFVFASAIAREVIQCNSVLPDLPLHITHPSGHYTVSNYDDDYLGPLIVRRALANSRNIPAVEIVKRTGLDHVFGDLQRWGLASGQDEGSRYGLGVAIGGLYCSLEQLVAGYGMLAREGMAQPLTWFKGQGSHGKRQMDQWVARQITLFLADAQARLPSFPRMGPLEYAFPVAVKTGTSQGFRDAWCVAYSHQYVVGAWLGDKDWRKMNRVGGLAAAGLVQRMMNQLHPMESQGIATVSFNPPKGFSALTLCAWTGQRASKRCSALVTEYFAEARTPPGECAAHVQVAVDRRTGEQAQIWTAAQQVVIRDALELPPEYAVWANRRGLAPPPQSPIGLPIVSLNVQTPVDGSRVLVDPETPSRFQSLALRAAVEPRVPEIEWWVDGELYARAQYPYETRWPLVPGSHLIQAKLPRARVTSEAIEILVD